MSALEESKKHLRDAEASEKHDWQYVDRRIQQSIAHALIAIAEALTKGNDNV
jgi:hypothetical protein